MKLLADLKMFLDNDNQSEYESDEDVEIILIPKLHHGRPIDPTTSPEDRIKNKYQVEYIKRKYNNNPEYREACKVRALATYHRNKNNKTKEELKIINREKYLRKKAKLLQKKLENYLRLIYST